MSWPLFFLTYAVLWWLVLLMLLPVGVTRPENPVPGQPGSAPDKPNLRKKMLAATVITLVLTLGIRWLMNHGILTLAR